MYIVNIITILLFFSYTNKKGMFVININDVRTQLLLTHYCIYG